MTIQQTIEKAIEGGLKHPKKVKYVDAELALTFLMPEFWQSLGKALGWKEDPIESLKFGSPAAGWLHHWYRFIYHLAQGKTPEDFFKQF